MRLNLGSIQRSRNTSEMIADALRSAIMRGSLQSGQSLKQDEIAAEFQVSKIPVREALVQLQAEGLIKLIPSRGAIVSSLSFKEVNEIYEMRLALETIALRRAIPNMKPADFVLISHILDRIDIETDLSKWAELNWEFHETLYTPSQMRHLLATAKELHNNVVRFLIFYITQDQLNESQQQHREIVEKCREGDIEGACALLEQHLEKSVHMFAHNLGQEK